MFHLLLTACLSADPAICAERLLPSAVPQSEEHCMAQGEHRTQEWMEVHPDLVATAWRCGRLDELPALDLHDIGGGIFLHLGAVAMPTLRNRGEIANLGVVIGTQSVAVIDAGATRGQAEALFAAIRQRTDLPISHLILTHMHPDHAFGAAVFREAGAAVIGSARLGPALDARAEAYIRSYTAQIGALAMLGTRIIGPDSTVDGTATISLGPDHTLRLHAIATAHTDNDLTILHLETGTLFAGDLIVQGLLPTLDGALIGWLDYLEKDQPQVRRVVPGHGPAPRGWPDGRVPTREYLSDLRETTRASIAAGRPMSAAIGARDAAAAHRWQGYDITHFRNLSAAYKELEWE